MHYVIQQQISVHFAECKNVNKGNCFRLNSVHTKQFTSSPVARENRAVKTR